MMARLFEMAFGTCAVLGTVRERDDEGGWRTVHREGRTFQAAVVMDASNPVRIGESERMAATYTVTAQKGAGLRFHDVFKRLSDGRVFRVIGNAGDRETPDAASFAFEQVKAEAWELPR